MPVIAGGRKYYHVSEACAMVGISRVTFLRWVREGTFPDVKQRDWKGWRLFSLDDIKRLKAKVNKIYIANSKEISGL